MIYFKTPTIKSKKLTRFAEGKPCKSINNMHLAHLFLIFKYNKKALRQVVKLLPQGLNTNNTRSFAMEENKQVWKFIKGTNQHYKISNFGRVKSLDREVTQEGRNQYGSFTCTRKIKGKELSLSANSRGYLYVDICDISRAVHRMVGNHFVPNPHNKPEINHLDGNKLNNYYKNLEWATAKENIDHAVKNNLRGDLRGSNNGMAKLTEFDIPKIRELSESGFSQRKIAGMYDVSRGAIKQILNGNNWSHV